MVSVRFLGQPAIAVRWAGILATKCPCDKPCPLEAPAESTPIVAPIANQPAKPIYARSSQFSVILMPILRSYHPSLASAL